MCTCVAEWIFPPDQKKSSETPLLSNAYSEKYVLSFSKFHQCYSARSFMVTSQLELLTSLKILLCDGVCSLEYPNKTMIMQF